MSSDPAIHARQISCRPAAIAVVAAALVFAAEARACDTAMICAWQRTFYTHNYLDSPLRAYNMPRVPNCNCWGSHAEPWTACQPPVGTSPAGFERLGRIPNDLELGAIATGAPPGR